MATLKNKKHAQSFEGRIKRRAARKLSQSLGYHGKASIAKSQRKERNHSGNSKHKQRMSSLPEIKIKVYIPSLTKEKMEEINKVKEIKKQKHFKRIENAKRLNTRQ